MVSYFRGDIVTIVCLVLWTFYLFPVMFLVYLSQGLHVSFFYTYLTLQRLFWGESSWIDHGTLWCVQWRQMTLSYLLSCWCSMQRANTFLFDWPIYLPLYDQSNWYTAGWLLGSSFSLFWHRMLCKFLPDVKVMSLFTFLNSFLIFGPILGIHGIFFLLVSLWLWLFLFLVL